MAVGKNKISAAGTGFRMRCLVLAVLAAAVFVVSGCDSPPAPDRVDIVQALSGDDNMACYARADRPASLKFPRDLGSHPEFKTEWWYYTGNVNDGSGRAFGFQLTFFRQALGCETPRGRSDWHTRQLYFAHFAITDVGGRTFYAVQRMNRGSVGIAGAQSRPFKVWIDNWSAAQFGRDPETLRLTAQDRTAVKGGTDEKKMGIDLRLTRTKPMVLQGDRGWSRKGPGNSDASYYYSFPGMAAQGRVMLGDETIDVSGRVWFDHEWSTAALGQKTLGWDWFAFHITRGPHAGADIMVCQVRQRKGPPGGFGSISFADGTYQILDRAQFSITALAEWKSLSTRKIYPSRWQIRLPEYGLDLEVIPVIPDQEHPHGFAYYEGAVTISGRAEEALEPVVLGQGYVEMTGY